MGLEVHSAGIQDRDGAPDVLNAVAARFPMLRHVFADGGYAGPKLRDALKALGRCRRLSIDWEKSIASAQAWILIAHIRCVTRNLARS